MSTDGGRAGGAHAAPRDTTASANPPRAVLIGPAWAHRRRPVWLSEVSRPPMEHARRQDGLVHSLSACWSSHLHSSHLAHEPRSRLLRAGKARYDRPERPPASQPIQKTSTAGKAHQRGLSRMCAMPFECHSSYHVPLGRTGNHRCEHGLSGHK